METAVLGKELCVTTGVSPALHAAMYSPKASAWHRVGSREVIVERKVLELGRLGSELGSAVTSPFPEQVA